ncbi:NYN domain-containing protein [Helicobacter pylori]
MEKTETTIFVDWENLLTDLRAIQKNPKTDKRFKEPDFSFNNPEQLLALIRSFLEPEEELKRIYFYASEPFTEVEPRIKGKDKEDLEKLKKNHFEYYEKKVKDSEIHQAFNNNIKGQSQVTLRTGRVKYKFENIYEEERHFGIEVGTNQERLDLRQKGIDALLTHDITKLYCTKQGGCILLFSKDTDFVPVLEAAWEKDFEVFIANIQEGPNLVPPDLRKSCDVRERSVAEILAKLPKVATTSNTPKKENSNEPFNSSLKDQFSKNG